MIPKVRTTQKALLREMLLIPSISFILFPIPHIFHPFPLLPIGNYSSQFLIYLCFSAQNEQVNIYIFIFSLYYTHKNSFALCFSHLLHRSSSFIFTAAQYSIGWLYQFFIQLFPYYGHTSYFQLYFLIKVLLQLIIIDYYIVESVSSPFSMYFLFCIFVLSFFSLSTLITFLSKKIRFLVYELDTY